MRGTAFFTLGVLQSIYHRLHNIIATKLKILNPQWEDDRLFQEAKRINIAIYQNNVYTEWLRVFVGMLSQSYPSSSSNNLLTRF